MKLVVVDEFLCLENDPARPMFWARTCAPERGIAAFESFGNAIDGTLITLSGGSEHHLSEGGKAVQHLPPQLLS